MLDESDPSFLSAKYWFISKAVATESPPSPSRVFVIATFNRVSCFPNIVSLDGILSILALERIISKALIDVEFDCVKVPIPTGTFVIAPTASCGHMDHSLYNANCTHHVIIHMMNFNQYVQNDHVRNDCGRLSSASYNAFVHALHGYIHHTILEFHDKECNALNMNY